MILIKNINKLNNIFGDKFTKKNYKRDAVEFILGRTYTNENLRNYYKSTIINKNCKLNQIFESWKYVIFY